LNDDDLNNFSKFLQEKHESPLLGEASTFESFLSSSHSPEQRVQEVSQSQPLVSPFEGLLQTSVPLPAITNCIKLSSLANQGVGTGPRCIKIEPLTNNIKLIKTSQPITLTGIAMPLMKPIETPQASPIPGKRRRSASPTPVQSPVSSTITLDQLKAQYGNVNVRSICSFERSDRQMFSLSGRDVEETSSNDQESRISVDVEKTSQRGTKRTTIFALDSIDVLLSRS
jgi:hypothetical protein